jgi:hypothetical protein
MMFLLKQEQGPDRHYLISNKEYVIGRKNTDIVIGNDQSISRKHAIIKIVQTTPVLIDCDSKYGTFHNHTKIEKNIDVYLKANDVIKFGVYQSMYRLEKVNVVTTGSGLNNEQKSQLKNRINAIGGSVLNNWEESCTHITTQELMLTVKVLHALVDDKPIVKLEYWDQFLQNMKELKPPPDVSDFEPPVAESLINKTKMSFNPTRRILFTNKTFVFATEKIRLKMADLIAKTGGHSISWEKQSLSLSQVTKSKNSYLFIQEDLNNVPPLLKDIYDYLTKLGERTIPIQEIAMAIVLCSCEKDCNPKFNRVHNVFMKQWTESHTEAFHLAQETPSDVESQSYVEPKKEVIIPGSLDADLAVFVSPRPTGASSSVAKVPFSGENSVAGPSTSSGVVRRNDREPAGSPSKKARMDDYFPRTSTASVLRKIPVAEPKTQPSLEPRKRKADENLERTPKKSSLRENPFAMLKNKTATRKPSSDNPFAGLRIKKEDSTNDSANPFKKIVGQSSEERHDVELAVTDSGGASPSFSQSYRSPDKSNVKWLSKTGAKSEPIAVDPEFAEIFEKFKNTVVIEVLPPTAIRVCTPAPVATPSASKSGKNFKVFKKVRPLRPQISVISTSMVDSTSRTNEITILSDGEEDEEVRRPVVKTSKPTKRFNF